MASIDPFAPADEFAAIEAARLFTDYLQARRKEHQTLSMIGPGRFLMPGDLAGSPALTFAPLLLPTDREPPSGSAWAMMRRRYDSYRDAVVRPFFRDHFARIDQPVEPPCQRIGHDAETVLEFIEPGEAVERIAQNEDAPPLAHPLQAAGYRAYHPAEAFSLH